MVSGFGARPGQGWGCILLNTVGRSSGPSRSGLCCGPAQEGRARLCHGEPGHQGTGGAVGLLLPDCPWSQVAVPPRCLPRAASEQFHRVAGDLPEWPGWPEPWSQGDRAAVEQAWAPGGEPLGGRHSPWKPLPQGCLTGPSPGLAASRTRGSSSGN